MTAIPEQARAILDNPEFAVVSTIEPDGQPQSSVVWFERDGDDLHCSVPISFSKAALGGEIDVPTLNGKAAIDIPEGTQTGKQFRLRGKGIKGVRASYPGDLYCHITVETPVKLTEHQRKLLKEFDESLQKGGAKHMPTGNSWTDKLKGLFGA